MLYEVKDVAIAMLYEAVKLQKACLEHQYTERGQVADYADVLFLFWRKILLHICSMRKQLFISLLRKVERHFLETCSVCQQALEQSLLASKQLSTWLTVASCMKDSKIGPVIENASSRVCTWHLHHRQETLSSHRGGMLFGALHPIKANQL